MVVFDFALTQIRIIGRVIKAMETQVVPVGIIFVTLIVARQVVIDIGIITKLLCVVPLDGTVEAVVRSIVELLVVR